MIVTTPSALPTSKLTLLSVGHVAGVSVEGRHPSAGLARYRNKGADKVRTRSPKGLTSCGGTFVFLSYLKLFAKV